MKWLLYFISGFLSGSVLFYIHSYIYLRHDFFIVRQKAAPVVGMVFVVICAYLIAKAKGEENPLGAPVTAVTIGGLCASIFVRYFLF